MHMNLPLLPPRDEMLAAMLRSDAAYEGVFFTAVLTTGIFCRPTCPARKPLPANVTFFASAQEALNAGFRACLRCRPLSRQGEPPDWMRPLLAAIDADPDRRWTLADMDAHNVAPARARAWFKQHYGASFSDYVRNRRLGNALARLQDGEGIDEVSMACGYDSLSGFREAFQKEFGVPPGKASTRRVLHYKQLATPLGPMLAMAEGQGVVLLEFCDRPALPGELAELRDRYGYAAVPGEHPLLDQLQSELEHYFKHGEDAFKVPLHMPGTPFEHQVWTQLRQLPRRQTCSYAQLAERIGRPTAVRAVAGANGRNRLAILVPCHRVIASDGSLGGYGGGMARKAFLLKLESLRSERHQ